MGLQLPKRSAGTLRRVALLAALGTTLVLLSGCSAQTQHEWKNFAMPDPATEQANSTFLLWRYAWIAALVTGVIVWGLIFWVVVAYRRRSDDEIPIQTRYNLPLEIFYTVAPIMMVIVFFYWTVNVQNTLLDDDVPIDNTIEVTGQQWQWTFNYGVGDRDAAADEDVSDLKFPYSKYVYEAGTGSYVPTLVLPVDETTRFNLHSPDVIHDFGVPAFLFKMDVVPGRVNHYQVTPTELGEYAGKCFELCGVYHSRMIFKVKVVSQGDYAQYLTDREAAGKVSDKPLLGGSEAYTQAGLAGDLAEEGTQ